MSEIAPELIDSRARAGAALREARLAAGRNIEELAAQLKVTPAKIAALESGDWSSLPDDTFGRALLRSSCKALRVDPQPLLDLLPGAPVLTAQPVSANVHDMANLPERPLPRAGAGGLRSRGLLGLAGLIAVLAAGVYFWPALRVAVDGLLPRTSAPAASTAAVHEAVPTPAQAESVPAAPHSDAAVAHSAPAAVASVPATPASSAAASASAAPAGKTLEFNVTAPSWVQVTARDGKVIFSALLQPGSPQTVRVPAASAPLAVVVGNAPSTRLTYDGKPVDLAPQTRANVARLTLN